jgi:hypothetical protein
MGVFIKESNYWAIHDAFLLGNDIRVSGTKLRALHKLIQSKGTVLNVKDKQIKGLEISQGTYVGMEVTSYKKNSFFPCKIVKYHFQAL